MLSADQASCEMTKGRLTIQCVGQSLRGVPKVSQARSLLKFDGSYCPIVEVSSKRGGCVRSTRPSTLSG